jgi:hypothetical protein
MGRLLLAVVLWSGLAGGALARTVEDRLIAGLRAEGFVIVEQSYTLLGRLRIVAEKGRIHREIVANPGTGEILRDDAMARAEGNVAPPLSPAPRASAEQAGAAAVASAPDAPAVAPEPAPELPPELPPDTILNETVFSETLAPDGTGQDVQRIELPPDMPLPPAAKLSDEPPPDNSGEIDPPVASEASDAAVEETQAAP